MLDISLPTLPVYNWRCEARIVNNQRMVEHQPAKKPPQRTQKCVHIHRTARTANIPPTIGVSSSPLIPASWAKYVWWLKGPKRFFFVGFPVVILLNMLELEVPVSLMLATSLGSNPSFPTFWITTSATTMSTQTVLFEKTTRKKKNKIAISLHKMTCFERLLS